MMPKILSVASRLLASGLLIIFLSAGPVRAANLTLYGTFHAMGVIVTLESGEDPDETAGVQLTYRPSGDTAWRPAYPPTRISAGQFTGSLFFLDPGTLYEVQVSFNDPEGLLDGVVLEASETTRSEIALPLATNSYYVSPDGSGTVCSQSAPCSLSAGISTARAGDEVVLLTGTYFEGEISLPRSGSAGAPIVIRGEAGGAATIHGADPSQFVWMDQGQGVFSATVNAADTHLVTVDGQRLFPYDSLENLETLAYGVPGFFSDGVTLYLNLDGDDPGTNATIRVSRYNYAFSIEQNHIVLSNLTFTHFGRGSWAKAVYFNNASRNLVRDCTFSINDLGIGLKRASHENLIEHNEFYDTIFQWPWDPVKTVSHLETGGVRFYDPVNGRGNVIRYNRFHDYFDGFGVSPASTNQVTNETDVYGNLVYNVGDDGVEVDGRAANVRLWDNVFHDVLMGISLAPVYDGPVYVLRNLIYRTGAGNSAYTGSPFKFNSGYDASGPMFLFHNTCDAVLPGNNGIYIKAPGTWENITARNNIWSGTDYAMYNYNTSQPVDFDYDVLYTTRTDEYVYWGSGPDRHMHDIETFRTLTGQEQNGMDVLPEFVDAPAADYRPDPNGLLVDNGVRLPGINDGYTGLGPDIGALESSGACLPDRDGDGDADGLDLSLFAADPVLNCLVDMAADFGN